MQRHDERDYSRRRFEDDDRSWSGRYADEDRERWGRGERFAEGRQEAFGQRGSGGFGLEEPERGWYGGMGRDYRRSSGGFGREQFSDRDDPYRYSGDFGQGGSERFGGYGPPDRYGAQYGRSGQRGGGGYGQPFLRYTEIWMIRGPHTGRGPRGYRRSDERIREEVCERLTQHGEIDASDLEVDVHDGEVTLRGMVDSRQTRRMAEDAIEDISGVRDVNNQIRVRQGAGGEHRGGYGSAGAGMATSASASGDRFQLRRGMDVAGSDGKTIGKVKEIRDNDFLLERSMRRDVYVPFTALTRVADDRATLNVVGDHIDDLHWETPSAPGEPGWSLPTSGSSQAGSGQAAAAQTTGRGAQRQPVAAGAVGQSGGIGYRYGQEMANDPRYRGRRWEEAEPELRAGYSDWARRQGTSAGNDDSAWERLHEEVRRAWDESRR